MDRNRKLHEKGNPSSAARQQNDCLVDKLSTNDTEQHRRRLPEVSDPAIAVGARSLVGAYCCSGVVVASSPAASQTERNAAANDRERARMRVLSGAFTRLKTSLPWVPPDTKLSKLDILRLASCYIVHLNRLLAVHDSTTNNDESTGENVRGTKKRCDRRTGAKLTERPTQHVRVGI